MDSLKKAIGNAVIMWIVGTFPIIFSVIYYAVDESGKYGDIAMCISLLLGGALCAFVMKKEHHAGLKEYFSKPEPITMLLVISTALFYVLTCMYTLNRPMFTEKPEADAIEIISLILASTIAPVGEELIYRFAMLTLLLTASKGSKAKNLFSIIIVSAAWMVMHFSGYIPRILDLIIIGLIIGYLYLKSRNILYCTIFHITANVCTYSFAAMYQWFFKREYILYISAVIFLLSIVMLFYHLCNNTHLEFFKKDNII